MENSRGLGLRVLALRSQNPRFDSNVKQKISCRRDSRFEYVILIYVLFLNVFPSKYSFSPLLILQIDGVTFGKF